MLKSGLTILTQSWNYQNVTLCCSQHPLTVPAHFNTNYCVRQTWKKSFCILTNLFIKTNCSISATNSQTTCLTCSDSIKVWTLLVNSFCSDFGLWVQSGINCEHRLRWNCLENLTWVNLWVLSLIANLQLLVLNKIILVRNFVNDLSGLQIKINHLLATFISKHEFCLIVMKH